MTWLQRLGYKAYRFPLVTFFIGPIYIFIFRFRFCVSNDGPKERRSVYICNAVLAAIYGSLVYAIGWEAVLMVQVPISVIAHFTGVYLFYVQHQYEDTYWEHDKEWDYYNASIEGSSSFKMPKVFQWFSGNIGFHHIHHLSHLIPNYNLEKCYNENAMFRECTVLTLGSSVKSVFLHIYDQDKRQLISFREYRRRFKKPSLVKQPA